MALEQRSHVAGRVVVNTTTPQPLGGIDEHIGSQSVPIEDSPGLVQMKDEVP